MSEPTEVEADELLRNISGQFYTETPPLKFVKDRPMLLKAITWPATWLQSRGITWTRQQYFDKIRELLQEVKRHGATGNIQYFPGYLMKVLQDHFAHNSDEYCDQGKHTRNAWERAIGNAAAHAQRTAGIREAESDLDALAKVHRVLASGKRRSKTTKPDDAQGSLFDV